MNISGFGAPLHMDAQSLVDSIAITGRWLGRPATVWNIVGRRAGFTSISLLNDVVEFAVATPLIPVLTGIEPLEVVSSSANDTQAGTGARSVQVTYVNSAGNMVQSDSIALNGVTPVPLTFTAKSIQWMSVSSLGSTVTQAALGDIRVRIVAGSVEIEQITAGFTKSKSGRFMIPGGYTGYLQAWSVFAVNQDQDVVIQAQLDTLTHQVSPVFHYLSSAYVALNTNAVRETPFIPIPELTIVKVSTISAGAAATVRCGTSFIIVLLQN